MGEIKKFSFSNIKFKAWHGVLIAVLVLSLGLGVSVSKYASAWNSGDSSVQTIPPAANSAQRGGYVVEGAADAATTVQSGVSTPSVNAPTGAPGSGSQPIPSFSGLNVKGAIVNSTGPLMMFDDAILYGLTDVRNGLLNSTAGSPITIYDNLTLAGAGAGEPGNLTVGGNSVLNGTVDVRGTISNQGIAKMVGKPVTINDNLSVNGNINIVGDGISSGNIDASNGKMNHLEVGSISNVFSPLGYNELRIDDDLTVTGGVTTINGALNAGSANVANIQLTATNIRLLGATSASSLTVATNSTVSGNISLGGSLYNPNPLGQGDARGDGITPPNWINAPVSVIDGFSVVGGTFLQGELVAKGRSSLYGGVTISGSIGGGGAFTPGSLTVDGGIKAGSIGQYYKVDKTAPIAANSNANVRTRCLSGDIMMGCTGGLVDQPSAARFLGATIYYVSPTIECRAYGSAGAVAVNQLISEAMCFNPNGNATAAEAGTTLTVLNPRP